MVRLAAFHAQQAVEKDLKAWLVALGEETPQMTHDLLHDPAVARGAASLPREPLRFLNGFAIRPRYGLGHLAMEDAERAVREAG
jgi:HEPN domain-containing protein